MRAYSTDAVSANTIRWAASQVPPYLSVREKAGRLFARRVLFDERGHPGFQVVAQRPTGVVECDAEMGVPHKPLIVWLTMPAALELLEQGFQLLFLEHLANRPS